MLKPSDSRLSRARFESSNSNSACEPSQLAILVAVHGSQWQPYLYIYFKKHISIHYGEFTWFCNEVIESYFFSPVEQKTDRRWTTKWWLFFFRGNNEKHVTWLILYLGCFGTNQTEIQQTTAPNNGPPPAKWWNHKALWRFPPRWGFLDPSGEVLQDGSIKERTVIRMYNNTRKHWHFFSARLCQVVARNLEHAAEALKSLGLKPSQQLPSEKKMAYFGSYPLQR